MNNRANQLGWILSAVLCATLVATGFQGDANKFGVVDITSVIERSKFGIAGQSEFAAMKAAREGLLAYVNENRIVSADQAIRMRELSLKPNLTTEEKAELERIKADIQQAEKRNKELIVKSTLTPEERTLVQEYANRSASMDGTANRWYQEFMAELQTWADKRKVDSLEKARVAIQEAAKAQGFTIVFEVGVAPYGANNVTDAALKAMDAKS